VSKRDVQQFVQAYIVGNNVKMRWLEGKPGKDTVSTFTKRWRHKVKVKKPTHIKRGRAVDPEAVLR